jgi:hypothetical protein
MSADVPAIIRKECRSAIAVKIMSIIFKGDKMSSRSIATKMYELYHGVADNIMAQIDMFMTPSGIYVIMFEKKYKTITGSSDQQAMNYILNKNLFILDNDYYLDRHLTKQIMECKTPEVVSGLVSGRNLYDIGHAAIANNKKALAFLKMMDEVEALTPYGVEYTSGNTEAEVKIKLLQMMYVVVKKNKNQNNNDDDPTESTSDNIIHDASVEKTRPRDWYYNGWFAFCMFGPFVPEQDRVTIIETGGKKSDTDIENGRKEQRKQKKIADNSLRDNDVNNKRGLSYQMKLGVASLELKAEDLSSQKREQKLLALKFTLEATQQDIERADKRAFAFAPNDLKDPLWKKVFELESESTNIKQEIKNMAMSSSPPPKRTKISNEDSPSAKN